ncbi:AMP-binding protein, partial [Rhodococcus sp. EPR-157]|uniref:AMP-binding protein n=1 Tax=Rhodococcus sp. EPR-157 TaxID=1813677 RepID=UPI000A7E14A0
MLSDSGAVVGVTVSEYVGVLGEAGPGVGWLVLDEVGAELDVSAGVGVSLPVPSLDDVAYLIYTSGSTGVPKGVVVTHRGIANLAEEQRTRFGVTTDSRVLAFASTSFDASVLELVLAFCGGATMVIAPTDV